MNLLWGHAWHGEWRPAGLKLPNDDIKTIAWAPQGGPAACPDWYLDSEMQKAIWPSYGDCFDIKIPGQPAVTTPAPDAAAGRQWRNYALMSGATHSLCGVRIGRNRFIYIDPNGAAWLATLQALDSGSTISVEFKRFGQFLGAAETYSIDIAPGGSIASAAMPFVLDVSRTGMRVSIGVRSNSFSLLIYFGAVTFSGVPGVSLAWTALSPIADYSNTVSSLSDNQRTSGTIASLNNGQIGNIFDNDDSVAVSSGLSVAVTAKTKVGLYYTPVTISGNIFAKVGAEQFDVPFVITQSWPNPMDSFNRLVSIDIFGDTFTYSVIGDFWMEDIPQVAFIRRSNRVIEAAVSWSSIPDTEIIYGYGAGAGLARSVCICLPDRFESTNFDIPANGSDARYFSYHPVTRDLLSDTAPVCWM